MRAISDYLRKEFAARGIPEITDHSLVDGQQCLSFADRTVTVSPFASDAEIKSAVFKAHGMTDDNIETVQPDTAATLPAVTPIAEPAVAVEKPKASKPIPAGSHAPGTLAGLLKALRDRKAAVMDTAISEAQRAHKALDHVERVTGDMSATTDGIMAELGGFTNFPDQD